MKLDDDYEKESSFKKMMPAAFVALSVVFIIIIVVIIVNKDRLGSFYINSSNWTGSLPSDEGPKQEAEVGNSKDLFSGSDLTSDQLDIWEDYSNHSDSTKVSDIADSELAEDNVDNGTGKSNSTDKADPSKDGFHTLITHTDGTSEWVAINSYLPVNSYDTTNLVLKDTLMQYYTDGKKTSYNGIMISEYDDYIDFGKVKKDGVDFVIIRLGFRSYGNGEITEDTYFTDNMKRAEDAGLKIGVSFETQAISRDEIKEETDYVIQSLTSYHINYPVVLVMKPVINDIARTDQLKRAERTQFASDFLNGIKENGYTPALYANKEWLLTKINYASLTTYDIWLSNPGDLPDYPYHFCIWEYSTNVKVDGIRSMLPISISFVDYSAK